MRLSRLDRRNLFVSLVIVAVLFLFLFVVTADHDTTPEDHVANIKQTLQNTTVSIPEGDENVELSSGSAQLPPNGTGGYVKLSGPYLQVGDEHFGILGFNYGGSGVFEYLGVWTKGESGEPHEIDAISLGDRVKVIGVTASGEDDNYKVTVDYLDYGPGESYADEPTVESSVMLKILDHRVVDTK